MSDNSKKLEMIEMKMEAMKKVYAEVILNTSKEAAARVMLADRKALRFHKELVFLKEDSARIMLHLNNSFKSQIQVAEALSLNQQKKIDELEAQLGEAEGIIVDLRDELKQLHEKLETMVNNKKRPSNGHTTGRNEPVHECRPQDNAVSSSTTSQVSDAKNALVGSAFIYPIGLNYKSAHVMDSYSFPGKSNLDDTCVGNEDFSSFIMQNTEADLCRNGYSQRIHAFERNLSTMKPPTLKDNDTESLANVLEYSDDKARKINQYPVSEKACIMSNTVQSMEQPFLVCSSKTDEKNMNSISYNKNQAIRTPRRSAGKNARYREAISSLRGKPRKKYVKSWKRPLLGQLKACSSHLNLHSAENPIVSEGVSPKSELMNRDKLVIPGGELDNMVSGEGDGEELREGLSKKTRLTSVDGLVGSELVDVPISEGFGSFHPVEKIRPLKFTFHRRCRKNVLRKLDENIVPEIGAVENPIVSEGMCPKSEVMNRGKLIIPGGELDNMVPGEGDGEEMREGLSKKTRLTSVDGLVGSELVDVPISEGFGSFHQVEKVRPLKFTFHRKCRKNVLCKLDENIVPEKGAVKRKLEELTDVSVIESNGLNNEMHRALEMSRNDASCSSAYLDGWKGVLLNS